MVGCGDHVTAGDGRGLAVRFFIATENDGDFGLLEGTRGLQCFQRVEHVDEAALHVVDAGTSGYVAVHAVGLERAGFFKDRVHVADEEHALAAFFRLGAGMFGDEHAGAIYLRHRDPLHLEAEVGELLLHDLTDGADAFKIVRAAVDASTSFSEQGIRRLLVGVDVGDDGFLHSGRGLVWFGRTGRRKRKQTIRGRRTEAFSFLAEDSSRKALWRRAEIEPLRVG